MVACPLTSALCTTNCKVHKSTSEIHFYVYRIHYSFKKGLEGSGDMAGRETLAGQAQWLESEATSKLSIVARICNSKAGKAETGGLLELTGQAAKSDGELQVQWGTLSPKIQGEHRVWPLTSAFTHTLTYICTYKHIPFYIGVHTPQYTCTHIHI